MSGSAKTKASTLPDDGFSLRAIIAPMMAIIVGMIMVILDSTVVNVAVPTLVKYFDTDLETIQWTITGYTLALSAVIPLAGWLSDKFGSKQTFITTVALFTLGSVLCGIAQTPTQLIIFRILQGLGGGMVAPLGMAMVFRLAPANRRGSIMGMLGIPMLLAPALGPILSGWLVDSVSWHWIFIINLPIGILAVILGIRYLPKSDRNKAPHLDIFGMLLAPIAFAMLAFGVSQGGTSWTSASTLIGLSVGGVALIIFIFVELGQKQPLLELRSFRSSDFTRGIILAWLIQFAMFGSMLIVPLYLQNVRHYSALETGLILLPQALCAGIGMPIGGRLFDKIGARPLAFGGLTFVSIALFILSSVTIDTNLWVIMVAIALMGLGMGFAMMPLNTHVLNAAPRHLVSRVTPLTTAAQQVVVSFAIAGLTGYLTSQIGKHAASAGKEANPLISVVSGYGDTFFLAAFFAVAGVLLSLILRKPKPSPSDQQSDGEKPDASMMVGH